MIVAAPVIAVLMLSTRACSSPPLAPRSDAEFANGFCTQRDESDSTGEHRDPSPSDDLDSTAGGSPTFVDRLQRD
jgi:hypothetical protein